MFVPKISKLRIFLNSLLKSLILTMKMKLFWKFQLQLVSRNDLETYLYICWYLSNQNCKQSCRVPPKANHTLGIHHLTYQRFEFYCAIVTQNSTFLCEFLPSTKTFSSLSTTSKATIVSNPTSSPHKYEIKQNKSSIWF